MLRFLYAISAVALCAGCELYVGDGADPTPDAGAVAEPPHETPPPECLGPDCAGAVDAAPCIDAATDAAIDADTATHPPNPLPCSRTCVGASCALCDGGVDA
jgi:hypothetical protein